MTLLHRLQRLVVAGAFVLAACGAGGGVARAQPADSILVADSIAALGATAPDLGRARAYVTDAAGILKAREQGRIERYLAKVERELGVQFAVITVETTRPHPTWVARGPTSPTTPASSRRASRGGSSATWARSRRR